MVVLGPNNWIWVVCEDGMVEIRIMSKQEKLEFLLKTCLKNPQKKISMGKYCNWDWNERHRMASILKENGYIYYQGHDLIRITSKGINIMENGGLFDYENKQRIIEEARLEFWKSTSRRNEIQSWYFMIIITIQTVMMLFALYKILSLPS